MPNYKLGADVLFASRVQAGFREKRTVSRNKGSLPRYKVFFVGVK
jgi:hypothetical protein